MQQVNIFKTEQELVNAVAAYFIKIAQHAIEEKEEFNVALSGGHSPGKLYRLLSSGDYKNQMDWARVNFFFGDERYVPENDPQRNSLMVQQALFDPLKISPSHIFKVDTTLPPEAAAKQYDETIITHFKKGPVHFDLVLLGLGDNAHTASLFPHTPVLNETSATVKAVYLNDQNRYRITMTAPLLNQSKHIAFLVYGKEKSEAVHHVMNGAYDAAKYPAQLVKPAKGELLWFLDEAAASLLLK